MCIFANAQYQVYTTPVVPMSKPVAGHFSGELNGQLWTWGGYGYPSVKDSSNVNKEIYAYAGGASVEVPQGTVCIGGTIDGHKSLSEVFLSRRVTYKESNMSHWQYDRGSRKSLPALPKPLHYNVAAFWDGYLYVVGGYSDSIPNFDVYRLEWPNGTAWDQIGSMPGAARIRSVCAVQMSANGPALYVFGGYIPATETDSASMHTDGICMNLKTYQWRVLDWGDIQADAIPSVGASARSLGCASIAVHGGVDTQVFTDFINNPNPHQSGYYNHPAEWYKYRQDVLIYNTYTDSWNKIKGCSDLALVDAGYAKVDGFWFVSGGEVKPGVCSSQVSCVELIGGKQFSYWDYVAIIMVAGLFLAMLFRFREKSAEKASLCLDALHKKNWFKGISVYMSTFGGISFWVLLLAPFVLGWSLILSYFASVLVYYVAQYYLLSRNVVLGNGGNGSKILVFVSGLSHVLRMCFWILIPSYIISKSTGIAVETAALLTCAVPIVAVWKDNRSTTLIMDAVQFLFMLFVSVALILFCVKNTGLITSVDMPSANSPIPLLLLCLLPVLMLDKIPALRIECDGKEGQINKSLLSSLLVTVIMSVLFLLVGMLMFGYYKNNISVFPLYLDNISQLSVSFMVAELPVGISGFFVAAFLGISWSALSRQVHAVSSLSPMKDTKYSMPSKVILTLVALFVMAIRCILF